MTIHELCDKIKLLYEKHDSHTASVKSLELLTLYRETVTVEQYQSAFSEIRTVVTLAMNELRKDRRRTRNN